MTHIVVESGLKLVGVECKNGMKERGGDKWGQKNNVRNGNIYLFNFHVRIIQIHCIKPQCYNIHGKTFRGVVS